LPRIGLGHFVGLSVHDVGPHGDVALKEGMVMADVPKEIDEMERLLAGRKWNNWPSIVMRFYVPSRTRLELEWEISMHLAWILLINGQTQKR
jgi:hypothetical protein